MDLNEVAIFIKVVEKGSFTAAARALEMPKSTVSMKINSLEKRLGVTLLTRSTRQLRVTTAGEAFFLRATKGLTEILAAESAVRSEHLAPQGRFRISATIDIGNYVLPDLSILFLKRFPNVQLEIVLTDRRVDFLSEEIDLALRIGELKDSSLIAKRVGDLAFQIYASPKYLKERGHPKSLKDLDAHDCVVFSPLGTHEWKLRHDKRKVTVSLPGKIVLNAMAIVHSFAMRSAGLALLPSYACASELKSGKLVHVLQDWRTGTVPLHFVYPAQKYASATTKAFIELAAAPLQNIFRVKSA